MSVYGLHFQQFPSFWFTYSAVLMSRISQFLVHIFSSFACLGVKKKKFLQRTRVLKTRVPTGEIFPPDALFRPRAKKNRASGAEKFPQWISSLRVSRSTGEIFFPPVALFFQSLGLNRASGAKKISPVDLETNFFFPRCSIFLGSRPKQSIWGENISPVDQIGLNGTNVD